MLSPDADELMTPNNILNMAMLKELDFVAITDHNSAKQLPTFKEIAEAYDFILIPGIEVTVQEGFDVLCYFRTYDDAYALDKVLEEHLDGSFGPYSEENQVITDVFDMMVNSFPKPLTTTSLPYKTLYEEVKSRNGAIVLAHIDRNKKSALNSYKIDEIPFDGIEIQQYFKNSFLETHHELNNCKVFASSDSHTLLTIQERIEYIELKEKSIDAFFQYLTEGD